MRSSLCYLLQLLQAGFGHVLQVLHGFGHGFGHGSPHDIDGIAQLAIQSYVDWRTLQGSPHVTHGCGGHGLGHGLGHTCWHGCGHGFEHVLQLPQSANALAANATTTTITTNSPSFFILHLPFLCDKYTWSFQKKQGCHLFYR